MTKEGMRVTQWFRTVDELLSYKPEQGLDKELLAMRSNKTLGV
jgi:hypothetical protein